MKLHHKLILCGFLLHSSASYAERVSGLVYDSGNCHSIANAVVRFTPPRASGQSSLVTATDGSGAFSVDLAKGEEYYLSISFGSRQLYGRVVKSSPDPLLIALRSSEGKADENARSGDQQLFCQLTASRKLATGQPLIENGQEVCGPNGDAVSPPKAELNQNKNRTDHPLVYIPLSWDDLKNLPSRSVSEFQGASVMVEGYLSHKIAVENHGSGESVNCHLLGNEEVDWHIYLTKSPAEPIEEAIIAETTPRVRPAHKWTAEMLTQYVQSDTKVRISGWLMLDYEQNRSVGRLRATAWEIHPITRIEVQLNGQWVDLDNQP